MYVGGVGAGGRRYLAGTVYVLPGVFALIAQGAQPHGLARAACGDADPFFFLQGTRP